MCSCILLPLATLTTYLIYKGSGANFAYMLMMFTFGFGILDLILFCLIPACISYNSDVQKTFNYCWYLLFLQGWEFAIKYLESAMNSQARPFLKPKMVMLIRWTVTSIYVSTMLTMYLTDIITYPGFSDLDKLSNWSATTDKYINTWSHVVWCLLIIFSTLVSICSIVMLARQISKLRQNNPDI